MGYRPITDMWFLARARLKGGVRYYGAYLGGFPERARALLGVTIRQPVLHVCGGMAHLYPHRGGYGQFDARMDMAAATEPEHLQDVREPWTVEKRQYGAFLIDPPYSPIDAEHYAPGPGNYPLPNQIMNRAFEIMEVGQRVGMIHYMLPACPKKTRKFIAGVGVVCGFNNRIRIFSVFEKMA